MNFMMQRRSFAPGAVLNSSLLKRYVLAEAQTWTHLDPDTRLFSDLLVHISDMWCLYVPVSSNMPLASIGNMLLDAFVDVL